VANVLSATLSQLISDKYRGEAVALLRVSFETRSGLFKNARKREVLLLLQIDAREQKTDEDFNCPFNEDFSSMIERIKFHGALHRDSDFIVLRFRAKITEIAQRPQMLTEKNNVTRDDRR